MVIYEVNLEVNPTVRDAYAAWLPGHIRKILSHDGFVEAKIFVREPGDEDIQKSWKFWTVQYFVKDRPSLERYLKMHSAHYRQEGIEKFGREFSARRRILAFDRTVTVGDKLPG